MGPKGERTDHPTFPEGGLHISIPGLRTSEPLSDASPLTGPCESMLIGSAVLPDPACCRNLGLMEGHASSVFAMKRLTTSISEHALFVKVDDVSFINSPLPTLTHPGFQSNQRKMHGHISDLQRACEATVTGYKGVTED